MRWGASEVARTCTAWVARETAHPPTFYLPLIGVQRSLLRPAGGGSFVNGQVRHVAFVHGYISTDNRKFAIEIFPSAAQTPCCANSQIDPAVDMPDG